MTKISLLIISLCMFPGFQATSYAGIITTEIYINKIINDDFGVDLKVGDRVGFFSFDDNTPNIDRDASDYGGLPEGIPTDTFVNYDPASNQYDGVLEAYFDKNYYDFSFSESLLPFQFNLELDSYVRTFNIEGIIFNTGTNLLTLDHSRRIFGNGHNGSMDSNRVIMGNDFENYIFEYKIRYPVLATPTPVPEPNTIVLFFMSLTVFTAVRFKQSGKDE